MPTASLSLPTVRPSALGASAARLARRFVNALVASRLRAAEIELRRHAPLIEARMGRLPRLAAQDVLPFPEDRS